MLKELLFTKVLPIIIALLAGLIYYESLTSEVENKHHQDYSISYHIPNFDSAYAINNVVSALSSKNTILLIGSSELGTELTELNARADIFFQKYESNLSLVSLGHAGNQSFSIYTQLLALKDYIQNSKIAIIVSPGWFSNRYDEGTSLESFLEYNNQFFLSEIFKNESDTLKNYVFDFVVSHYNDIQSPFPIHQIIYDNYIKQSFVLKRVFNYPLALFHQLENNDNTSLKDRYNLTKLKSFNKPDIEREKVNWDSLKKIAVNQHKAVATNNDWSINNDYYSEYVNGETFHQNVKPNIEIQELEDLKMLLYLLDYYKVDASFIVQPLNPYAYDNLEDLRPVLTAIRSEIEKYHYPLHDMFVYDTANYQHGILTDIMHLGELGWFSINEFLIDIYEEK
jgi:D-alanine transfer protein